MVLAGDAPRGRDCDDDDASIYPGAEDTWYDGIDSDCAGNSDYDQDQDGEDTIESGGTDCNDTNALKPEKGVCSATKSKECLHVRLTHESSPCP